jgi:JAB domain-containing protein similar to deubiquitination enzymes
MLVATQSFVDPSDGQWIEAGRTRVHESAEVARSHPQNFKPASGLGSGSIVRVGETVQLGKPRQRPQAPKRPFGYSHREAEFRESYVDYSVSISPYARDDILAEIKRAHDEAGEQVEVGGWLFSAYRPRAESVSTEIVYVTRSGNPERGTRTSMRMGDPIQAMAFVRDQGLGHLALCGDWHCHCVGGSELPSEQDVSGWCGSMDNIGRSAYVSLVVSPSESTGWTIPRFSAWVAGRYGCPSCPVVRRARLEW